MPASSQNPILSRLRSLGSAGSIPDARTLCTNPLEKLFKKKHGGRPTITILSAEPIVYDLAPEPNDGPDDIIDIYNFEQSSVPMPAPTMNLSTSRRVSLQHQLRTIYGDPYAPAYLPSSQKEPSVRSKDIGADLRCSRSFGVMRKRLSDISPVGMNVNNINFLVKLIDHHVDQELPIIRDAALYRQSHSEPPRGRRMLRTDAQVVLTFLALGQTENRNSVYSGRKKATQNRGEIKWRRKEAIRRKDKYTRPGPTLLANPPLNLDEIMALANEDKDANEVGDETDHIPPLIRSSSDSSTDSSESTEGCNPEAVASLNAEIAQLQTKEGLLVKNVEALNSVVIVDPLPHNHETAIKVVSSEDIDPDLGVEVTDTPILLMPELDWNPLTRTIARKSGTSYTEARSNSSTSIPFPVVASVDSSESSKSVRQRLRTLSCTSTSSQKVVLS